MKVLSMEVVAQPDGDLRVVGTDYVIANPLKDLQVPLDMGELWLRLWAENQHNKPNSTRIRAILLNQMGLSVQSIMTALQETKSKVEGG